jgi:aspartate carbamoyltransferase regulatory subunit
MLRKISHSDISLYLMPIYSSYINECMVCNKKIDSHKKMIVFNERYVPVGFSCKYCNSIYDEDDILVDLGNPDKLDLYGET